MCRGRVSAIVSVVAGVDLRRHTAQASHGMVRETDQSRRLGPGALVAWSVVPETSLIARTCTGAGATSALRGERFRAEFGGPILVQIPALSATFRMRVRPTPLPEWGRSKVAPLGTPKIGAPIGRGPLDDSPQNATPPGMPLWTPWQHVSRGVGASVCGRDSGVGGNGAHRVP